MHTEDLQVRARPTVLYRKVYIRTLYTVSVSVSDDIIVVHVNYNGVYNDIHKQTAFMYKFIL